MKPLVYWCRWHEAKLKLQGRGAAAVWGYLEFSDGRAEPFHFHLQSWLLILNPDDAPRQIQLDEMGVEVV
jgi:hypothetical protein